MQSAQKLLCLIHTILNANPQGEPIFMSKIDLVDAYMRVYIRPEDLPRIAFVIPLQPVDANPLIGFHLSLPIVYVDSAPYFFCTSDTVEDLANMRWAAPTNTNPHPILALAGAPPDTEDNYHAGIISAKLDVSITARLLPSSHVALLRYANLYIGYFIALAQGGPADHRRV